MTRIGLVLVFLALLSPNVVSAQTGTFDVAGGYAFLRDLDLEENVPKGWFASVGAGLTSWLSIAGEVSGHHRTFATASFFGDDAKVNLYFFGFGPRFVKRTGKVHPFGEVLIGGVRGTVTLGDESQSAGEFAWQPSGGVDFDITRTVGMRAGAGGRFIDAGGETIQEFRVIVGIVFNRRR